MGAKALAPTATHTSRTDCDLAVYSDRLDICGVCANVFSDPFCAPLYYLDIGHVLVSEPHGSWACSVVDIRHDNTEWWSKGNLCRAWAATPSDAQHLCYACASHKGTLGRMRAHATQKAYIAHRYIITPLLELRPSRAWGGGGRVGK